MCRRLTTLLLMLCLTWQGLAFAGSEVVLADGDELTHATLHWMGEAHHHDHHGPEEFHQDDSQASAEHLMDDACCNPPALVQLLQLPLPQLQPDMPAGISALAAPPPFLGGLERPPRLTA